MSTCDKPRAGIEWVEHASLDDLNSMGLRATARLLATVTDDGGLACFLQWAESAGEDFIVLGAGTNVILAEEFLDCVIVRLDGQFAQFDLQGEHLTAGAAAPLSALVEKTRQEGLSGLEGGWGIPGLVGGALIGNAGASGWAIGDHVEWVEVCERSAARKRLAAAEIGFSYRKSTLANFVVTRARFVLQRAGRGSIEEVVGKAEARRSRHPRGASAGCIFKNPPGQSAGRLIDEAGLAGLHRGGAVVSAQHANFIINEGGATASDVLDLIEEVRCRVFERFHIQLETEVRILSSSKLKK
ncbi:UDP-N-acetylmuramate dehydrogenase [Candidatus Sumerlaeota bacterium]|nr:UDP-N-acetylmuramate dehydrogenase [Candidatus Sumerlaeota bacterium]